MGSAVLKVSCTVKSRTGSDLFGEPVYGPERKTKCAVIKLTKSRQTTTVRTDSAGTRGHADEAVLDGKLLMSATENIKLDDFVMVSGITLRVSSIEPRFDPCGNLDHQTVGGSIE